MALGPFCKGLGIDEEVLNGQKEKILEPKSITNGVMWELKKYKTAKKLSMQDVIDWLIKIFEVKCENSEALQVELNIKYDGLSALRGTLLKSPSRYRGEMDRLMNWQFDLPAAMVVEPIPVFEPTVKANLGPKLLKVLKEKGGEDEDSVDLSGPSDNDDDEQAKKRKAREEIIQLKKDICAARKIIAPLVDDMYNIQQKCADLRQMHKISVTERRRIEMDVLELQKEWEHIIPVWRECVDRLNHVNNNKGNYLDVGYMVRRNKTKQGIFDELNFEFEKTVEEFKARLNSMMEKEKRQKKNTSRENRQKGKATKRKQEETEEDPEEAKKMRPSEDDVKPALNPCMTKEEFATCERVEDFKGGRYVLTLKAIFQDVTTLPVPCKNVQDIMFEILDELETLSTEKLPPQSFAANLFMETRMRVSIQAFIDAIESTKVSVCNDGTVQFKSDGVQCIVTLPDGSEISLNIRNVHPEHPETSFGTLMDIFNEIENAKPEGNDTFDKLIKTVKTFVDDNQLLEKKLIEILFLYKQQMAPLMKSCLDSVPDTIQPKLICLNNVFTGMYFLQGLAQLSDTIVLAWESVSLGGTNIEASKDMEYNKILSKAVQQISTFADEYYNNESKDKVLVDFSSFCTREKKMEGKPFVPCKGNVINAVFHNSAAIWCLYETGLLPEYYKKQKAIGEVSESFLYELMEEKHTIVIARALGLVGKLLAVPLWYVFESEDSLAMGPRYDELLNKVEEWSKDASKFLKGQESLFEDVPISVDSVYVSLIKDSEEYDRSTKEIVELMFTAFVPYMKYFLFGNSSATAKTSDSPMEVDGDVKNEIHKDFAAFNRITKNIHSAKAYALDAMMLYSKTRNGEWQDKLSNKDNTKVFEFIEMQSAKHLKALYKRKIKLCELKNQLKEPKMDDYTKCQLIEKKYKLIDDLIKWGGLWKSEKEIDAQIKDLKENDKLNALRAQIRFRRHILGEQLGGGLLDLASEGECFNAVKLNENLKSIVNKECLLTETGIFELATATDDENVRAKIYESCKNAKDLPEATYAEGPIQKENYYWILGKLLSHTWVLKESDKPDKKEQYTGICIARKKLNGVYVYFIRYNGKEGIYKITDSRLGEDFKRENLKVVDPTSKDLVGSQLSRAFIKDDGDLEWHDCKVIDVITPDSEYVIEFDFYDINYQAEDDTTDIPELETLTFTTSLLEDYRTDHLRLL